MWFAAGVLTNKGTSILRGRTNVGFRVGDQVVMRNVWMRVAERGLRLDVKPALVRPGFFHRGELRFDRKRRCAMSAASSSGGGCGGSEE